MKIKEEKYWAIMNFLYHYDGATYSNNKTVASEAWDHKDFRIIILDWRSIIFYTPASDLSERAVWQAHLTFEGFLNSLPPETQADFLFHLDLFT